MSVVSFFKGLLHQTTPAAVGKVLTAAETVVSDLLPVVGDDLAAFIKTLPDARDSIFSLADQAIKLVADAKGQTLSFSMALHLAQAAFTAHIPEVVAEAEKLLTTGKL